MVFLFMPCSHDCPFAEPTAGYNVVNLEELSGDDLSALLEQLSDLEVDAGEAKLFLEDYAGRYALVTLQDIRESQVDLLPQLAGNRGARRDKLTDWARNAPALLFTGARGDMVAFDVRGVRIGARFVAWADLNSVQLHAGSSDDPSAYHLIPQRGSSSDALVVRIPGPKAELFIAECTFWRSLAGRRAESAECR
jgi:hypothetical protein